jgi:hypothetical protein
VDEVFDAALQNFGELQKQRVLRMYNRHRAMFAECLVAALLPGAEVVENPTAAWDIEWSVDGSPVRVQVKCSGQFLPMHGLSHKQPRWSLKEPKYGWAPESNEKLVSGHHCDAFVLARHSGEQIRCGWTFAVVLPHEVTSWTSVTSKRLSKLGRRLVDSGELERELRSVLASAPPSNPTDFEIEVGLESGDSEAWARIIAIELDLASGRLAGTWQTPEPTMQTMPDGQQVRVFQMGWVHYDRRVIQLVEDLYAVNAVASFDWGEWDGWRRYPRGEGLAEAHAAEAVRLVTWVVRGDRFSEGAIKSSLDDGTLAAVVSRLVAWRVQHER